ncbi:MAG: SDR family NAD(P)-dependent oxidoreductase, partial [Acidimicrobiia bacterium]
MQIKDRVGVITGGVSGLGFGAARRLIDGGASVVMLDINEDKGKLATAELGDKARFLACDVSDSDSVAAAVAGARETFGAIHILVNAAGVAPAQRVVSRDGTLHDLELFRFTIGVNLIGMFDMIRNVAEVMA